MEMSDKFHAPDYFPSGIKPTVPIRLEAGWTEPVWTLRRREKSLAPTGNRTPVVQPVAPSRYTVWALPASNHNTQYWKIQVSRSSSKWTFVIKMTTERLCWETHLPAELVLSATSVCSPLSAHRVNIISGNIITILWYSEVMCVIPARCLNRFQVLTLLCTASWLITLNLIFNFLVKRQSI
jgi:hypothetical protein